MASAVNRNHLAPSMAPTTHPGRIRCPGTSMLTSTIWSEPSCIAQTKAMKGGLTMRRLEAAIACALCVAWLAGCATSALEMAPPRPDRPWAPATTAEGDLIAGQKGPADMPGGYVLPANPA